jgi:signal transduction histidine kinase
MRAGLSIPVRMTEVRVLENLAYGVPVTEALSRVCDYIDGESPGAVSAVLMLNENEMQFRLVAGPRVPAPLSKAIEGLKVLPYDGISGTAPRQGRPVTVWDIRSDSLFADRRDTALSSGFTAAWSLPIWSTKRTTLGTVVIFHPDSRLAVAEVPKHMETAVHLAAIAIQHHHNEVEMRTLTRRLLQSHDDERRHIARDLHDSTGQDLASLLMMLGRAERRGTQLPPELAGMLSESLLLAEKISDEIRTLSCLLHPPLLDVCGLGVAIEAYANELNRRHELVVELEISPQLPRLSEDAEVALFRIVQTSLTNVHLHSGSSSAKIKIDYDTEGLTLTVSDQGRGIPAGVLDRFLRLEATGVGLAGMRERAKALGGHLEFETSENGPRHGTAVKVTIPSHNFRDVVAAEPLQAVSSL